MHCIAPAYVSYYALHCMPLHMHFPIHCIACPCTCTFLCIALHCPTYVLLHALHAPAYALSYALHCMPLHIISFSFSLHKGVLSPLAAQAYKP